MNKTYRLVWSDLTQTWVAVAENIRARGKRSSSAVLLASGMLLGLPDLAAAQAMPPPAPDALPTGGAVVAGQAGIQQSGANMTITQGSDRAAIDWNSFNVGSQARVDFVQPSSQSVTLNRVVGDSPSQIFGQINANGQVFLSNPGGVYFAPGASVDVGGLVATTHHLSVEDFMSGKLRFERQGATGSVVNEGELKAALGGYIALLAPEVRNQGVILAHMGTVALAAGEAFELQFDSNQTLANLRVEASTIRALVDNRSAVLAPGGLILLSAQAADKVQGGVIRNSGALEANGLAQRGGRIVLEASDSIANTGNIVASATAQGPAGSISLQAADILNSGLIQAVGNEAYASGGDIEIVAGNLTQTAAGVMDVSAPAKGGKVRIQASGQVKLAGRIEAASRKVVAADTGAIDAEPVVLVPTQPQVDSAGVQQSVPAADLLAEALPVFDASAPASSAETMVIPQFALASETGQGGSIQVQAASITLASARLNASGGSQGGHILLDASAPSPTAPPAPQPVPEPGKVALLGSTQLASRGSRGRGGDVTLLGRDIGLGGTTHVDVTGANMGGKVRVGGDWQGTGDLYQATTLAMGRDVLINASATQRGDGGTIVLWSDVTRDDSLTTARGTLLARGGALGGNGGRIETSGHAINIDGIRVDAGTEQGQGGLWLIDPYNYTIGQAQANTIASTLNTNTSVQVTTTVNNTAYGSAGGDGSAVGNITVSNNVSLIKSGGNGDATLTLQAHGGISFGTGSRIESTSGKLNLVLWSRLNPGNAGTIALNGTTLITNGGHIWMGGGAAAAAQWNGLAVGNSVAASWSENTAGLRLDNSSITTGGGHFYAGGLGHFSGGSTAGYSHGVRVGGSSINTGSGNLTLQGEIRGNHTTSDSVSTGLFVTENSTLRSTSGVITLQGTAASTNEPAGRVFGTYLTNKVTVQSDSGAINIYGSTTVKSANGAGIWLGSRSATTGVADGNQTSGAGNGYNVAVVSQSGAVLLDARATVPTGVHSAWVHAFVLLSYGADKQLVKTDSGNVTIKGSANVTRNDSSGVQFQVNEAQGNIHVVSTSGDIYVQGFQQSGSTDYLNNALRFSPGNSAGSIRFGAISDGASYTGRVTFEADSIWSRAASGLVANAIKVYGSGDLSFQSSGSSSVKDFLLAGTDNSGVVQQANLWDFGSAHSSFSIGKPTENKNITLGSAITAAGPISIQGGTIRLNNNLTSTLAGASIRLLASNSVTSTSAAGTTLTLTSNAGDVILAGASRGAATGNIDFEAQSLVIDTRPGLPGAKSTTGSGGGSITLGGGNTLGTSYANGVNNSSAEGIRARDLTLRSGGGEVNLRGRSWAGSVQDTFGAWGIGVYASATTGNLNIDSGTGRIRVEGIGRSTGAQSYKQGIAVYGATDIRSAYAGNDAVQLLGTVTATAGTEEFRSAVYLHGTSVVAATGNGGGLTISGNTTYAALWLGGAAYLLSNGGALNIKGAQLAGGSNNMLRAVNGNNVWFGSVPTSVLASSPVTTSSSALLLEFDGASWGNRPNIATSGAVVFQSNAAAFNQLINTAWINWSPTSQVIGGLTIGKVSNTTQNVIVGGSNEVGGVSSPLVVNGPVTIYGRVIEVTAPLTVTGSGDISMRSYADGNESLNVNAAISKTGGADATMTLRGNGRVNVYQSVIASGVGTGKLNLVVWADADGNRLGGVAVGNQTLTTNGGHVWLGGGAGVSTWNGLTVGDGASPGAYGSNHHGMDLNGTFNTGGGDFYAAAKTYVANAPDISPTAGGSGTAINAGSGNITLVGNRIFFGRSDNAVRTTLTTTGVLTIRPYDDSFTEAFNVVGSLVANNWVGTTGTVANSTGTYNLTIGNAASLGGLVIGKETNTRLVSVNNNLSILGNISIYGGQIRNLNGASLTSTAGNILLDADLGRTLDLNGRGIDWQSGALSSLSSDAGKGNVTLLGRGGSKVGNNQGVFLNGASLSTGGDLLVQGVSPAQQNTGVYIDANTHLNAGRTLTVDGRNLASVSSPNNRGVFLANQVSLNARDVLSIVGSNGPGAAQAIDIGNGVQIATSGANGHIVITALNSGAIGSVSGGNNDSASIRANGGGNITLSADRLAIHASKPLFLQTTGTLTIAPNSNSFPEAFRWDGYINNDGHFSANASSSLANVTIGNVASLGGLTLGKQGNLSDILVAANTIMRAAGPIRLFGQNLALAGHILAQGNSNADDNRIELHARGNVTQGSEALTAQALSLQGGGRFTLTANNNVQKLATGSIGLLSFVNNVALTIGSVTNTAGDVVSGVSSSGKVLLETLQGNLNLNANVSSGSSATDAVVINAGRLKQVSDADFYTGSGGSITVSHGSTVSTGAGGRATLYSGSVLGSTGLTALVGSGSGRFRYASDEVTTAYVAPLASGLYAIYRERPTVTLKGTDASVVYGNAFVPGIGATGLQNGDSMAQGISSLPTVTLQAGGSDAARNGYGYYDVRRDGGGNVIGYDMSLSGNASSSLGYALAYDASGQLTVTPRALSAVINDDAKFAGLPDVAGYAGASYSGFAVGESAANVGASAVITRSMGGEAVGSYMGALTGTLNVTSGNYVLDPAQVTAGNFYIVDGNTLIVRVGSANAVYGNAAQYDVTQVRYFNGVSEVSLTQGGSEFNWNVGGNSAQAVNFSLSSAGVNVGSHAITGTVSLPNTLPGMGAGAKPDALLAIGSKLVITPRMLTVAANKVYDGNDVLGSGSITLGNLVNGETLNYSNGLVSDRNVLTANKYVSQLTLSDGTGLSSNYILPDLATWDAIYNKAVITPRQLGVQVDKIYDGLSTATAGQTVLTNLAAGEALGIVGLVGLSDAHVATAGKYVTSLSLADSGAYLASNYQLPVLVAGAGNVVNITPRTLTVSGVTATGTEKIYDRSTAVGTGFNAVLSLDGYVAGDSATLTWLAAYDRMDVDAERIALSGLAMSGISSAVGSQASDYVFDGAPVSVAGRITPRTVNASLSGSPSKVYDGTNSADGAVVVLADATATTGRVGGDEVSIVGVGGSFSDANAGTGKSYTLIDIGLSGADARNYVLGSGTISGNDGIITPRVLTLQAEKVYDGSTALDTVTLGNLVSSEYLLVSGAVAATARVGGLDGNIETDDNYIRQITISDVLNAGNPVFLASNYSLPGQGSPLVSGVSNTLGTVASGNQVKISAALLSVQLDAQQVDKVYDGSETVSGSDKPAYLVTGLVSGDTTATLTQAVSAFNSANVAEANTYTASGIAVSGIGGANGSVASDYILDTTTLTLPGNITARAVAVNTNEVRKVYDTTTGFDNLVIGLAAVSGDSQSGLIAADAGNVLVQASGGGFDDKNAGTDKSYTLTGLMLTGSAASNYQIVSGDSISGLNGEIERKQLLVQDVNGVTKVYDGSLVADTTQAASSGKLAWVAPTGNTAQDGKAYLGDDVVLGSASLTGAYNSKDVASASTVTINGFSLSGADAANYQLATVNVDGTITAKSVTVSGLVAENRAYDGTTNVVISDWGNAATGVGNETLSLTGGSAAFADKNAADSITVTANGYVLGDGGNGGLASNYVLSSNTATTTADIERKQVTVSGLSADGKTYDGTTNAVVNHWGSVTTGVGTETLVLNHGSAAFADQNAADNIVVTASGYSLSNGLHGGLASNYVLSSNTATTTADIERKQVTISGLTADGKAYDGTTSAVVNHWGSVTTGVGTETLVLNHGSAAFADQNAADNIVVTASGYSLSNGLHGGLASNYVLSSNTATTTADISRKQVTISGLAADGKVYDGTTNAVINHWGSVTTGVGTETLVLNHGSAAFADQNAAGGIVVTANGYSLSNGLNGGLASNYVLSSNTATTTADITRKQVTINGLAADGKTYDGTTNAVISHWGSVTTGVGTETLVLNHGSAAFADQNAANNIVVTASGYSLSNGLNGGLASNYELSSTTATTTADIARKQVTISGLVADNKTYDGTTSVVISHWGSVTTGVGTETLGLTGASASFGSKQAANGKQVTASGYTLANGGNGGLASNYVLSSHQATTTANIGKATITAVTGIAADNKTYDGQVGAVLNSNAAAYTGMVAGDTLNVATATGVFADKNAGLGKVVHISGVTLGGADAGNYILSSGTATATADINRALITSVTGITAQNKTYDGRVFATLDTGSAQYAGLVAGDTLTVATAIGAFANKNAGQGKTVQISGLTLGGIDAGNYQLSHTDATTTADIQRASLAVIANDDARFVIETDSPQYGGVSYAGFVAGETSAVLSGAASVMRSNANQNQAGIYQGVLQADVSGLLADNYSFVTHNGNYTIVPSNQLLIRMNPVDSVYGTQAGYTLASAAYEQNGVIHTLPGVVDGNNRFTVQDGAGGSASFLVAPKNVALSGSGELRTGVYQLGVSESSTVNAQNFSNTITLVGAQTVTPKAVQASTTGGISKVYDGNNQMANLALGFDHVLSGDAVSGAGTGQFASRNAGTGIAYTVSGLTLSGNDAANYYLVGTDSFSGNDGTILKRTLILDYAGANKVYDGNTNAHVTASDNRVSGDALQLSWRAAFADKNVGNGKAIDIRDIALSGSDAGNYVLDADSQRVLADITRLESVVWVGGDNGNWFDPDNWAGGAVPDLGNVANVIIPEGVTVTFDTTGAKAPAETGTVQIDSLGQSGSLVQNDGRLEVGAGGVTLDTLEQNGGTLVSVGDITTGSLTQHGGTVASGGDITVDRFEQTGGSTSAQGNLLVKEAFNQSGSGTVVVQGNANLNASNSGMSLGNLQVGGNLTANSSNGDITQVAGTVISVGGNASLSAPGHVVSLSSTGNRFNGGLSISDVSTGASNVSAGMLTPVIPPLPLPVPDKAPQAISVMMWGDADSSGVVSAMGVGDGVVVRLLEKASDAGGGSIVVEVPRNMLSAGFSFMLPNKVLAGAAADAVATATLADGSPLPSWLTFDARQGQFVAGAAPRDGLPVHVTIQLGERQVNVRIVSLTQYT